MSELVPFTCPTHGWLLDTVPTARVYCARCKGWLPPRELAPVEAKRASATRRQAARRRRSRTRAFA